MPRSDIFVSTQWLADHLGAPDLVVVDASWHMPNSGRDGRSEFEEQHIPGAVHFDIDAIADKATDLPHMLPTPEAFAAAAGALGIGDGKTIVVYDSSGLFAAPRVRWTLLVFGAQDVKLLDGGLPQWLSEGRPTQSGNEKLPPATFTPHFHPDMVADMARVEEAIRSRGTQILDARSLARFRGEQPDPRPELRSGHMPGALNLPYGALIEDGRLKDEEMVRAVITGSGLDLSRPVITSCGSGVTAAVLWLALESIGHRPAALYDGSWTEWASRDKPIVTGS